MLGPRRHSIQEAQERVADPVHRWVELLDGDGDERPDQAGARSLARTTFATAAPFSETATSAQSAGALSSAPGGHWAAEFVGSVQAPAGDVWISVTAGCSGAGAATMTCDIVGSGVLKKS